MIDLLRRLARLATTTSDELKQAGVYLGRLRD
jgi:hypothetical protein